MTIIPRICYFNWIEAQWYNRKIPRLKLWLDICKEIIPSPSSPHPVDGSSVHIYSLLSHSFCLAPNRVHFWFGTIV